MRPWWSKPQTVSYAAVAIAMLALVICADHLAQRHALLGIVEYDDGVYVGATVRLVHGVIP